MKDYHINIFFSTEDGGYVADIPDLREKERGRWKGDVRKGDVAR